jgi:hypothetical protein
MLKRRLIMESIINPLIYGMRLLLVESAHIFCDEMELNVYDAEDAILHGTKNCIIDNVFEPTACNNRWV